MYKRQVKIHVGEGRFVATGESAGPVGALDAALRMEMCIRDSPWRSDDDGGSCPVAAMFRFRERMVSGR